MTVRRRDSQSVKTSAQGGPKGVDAGKKVKGRKRHLVVDVLGLLLAVLVPPANIQDRDGVIPVGAESVTKYLLRLSRCGYGKKLS